MTIKPTDRIAYALTLLAEAETTENAGVASANKENAVLCLLAAASTLSLEVSAKETSRTADVAHELMVTEGRSL